ncbi:LysE family transporter [Mycetocola miduiensis]|uniref:LysE type translocator n=1 Tax=Mycetocola miduiensis TaxID=995034 RepID=A0A1I4YXB3_9MICO|nr:LysE family transporter [Mycetocola miduiensis]SFN42642.1 LysE type translocator [Mycetocola miduiensis]
MSLFLIGTLAGLGVAMPLGAIGVLLIREGIVSGFRIAAVGAIAVATVDAAYCAVAVTLGFLAESWIDALGAAPALVSGVVLVALGSAGLARARDAATPTDASSPRSSIGVFARFAGLTAINPATLLYFLALAATLTSTFRLEGSSAAFVAGVGVASMGWQLGLAGTGALLARRLRPSGQRMLSTAGSAMVLALGIAALVAAAVHHAGT